MTQNSINNFSRGINAGIYLPNMKYAVAKTNVATAGNNDIYTVPAGKRAACFNTFFYNASAGTVGLSPTFKVSGTYYNRGGPGNSSSAGTSGNMLLSSIILEAGETLSYWASTTGAINTWSSVVEFDNTAIVKSVKTLNMATGDVLLYTCPAGKTAFVLDNNLGFSSTSGIFGIYFSNQLTTPGTTTYLYFVPNGQVVGATFRISSAQSYFGTATTFGNGLASGGANPTLVAGDRIYCNNSVASGSNVFFNVLEI